jgi:hypothetical protein
MARGSAVATLVFLLSLAPAGCAMSPSVAPAPRPGADTAPAKDWCLASELGSEEGKFGVTGALAQLNTQFLAAHARARAEECGRLERQRLVVRYSFGALEARWKGQPLGKEPISVLPTAFHPIKDVSHAVFLAALLFEESAGSHRDQHVADARAAVTAVIDELGAATSTVARMVPADLIERQRRILAATQAALDDFAAGTFDDQKQQAYFSRVRPEIEENLRVVSGALVRELDRNVRQLRSDVEKVDPRAWDSVVVVVGVSHQARAREIGIQYFERLLAEPVGEGARNERRLVVAESMPGGPEQYGLLAAHLVDREGAERIFGDASRLQWDVLADSGGVLDQLLPPRKAGASP